MSAVFSTVLPSLPSVGILVMTVVVVQCMRWWWWCRSYWKLFSKLPGPKEFSWIWGTTHMFRNKTPQERIDLMTELTLKYPRCYLLWIGAFRAQLILNHPDTVKQLLKTSEPKPFFYNFAIDWLGEGLLIAGGSKWARSRRLLTPAFHFDTLKPYVTVGNKAAETLLSKVKKYSDEQKSFEVFSNVSLCTLDVLLRCAMSYATDCQTQGESHPYVQAVVELTELWSERGRNLFVHPNFIYGLTSNGRKFKQRCKFVHDIAEQVISERQQSLESHGPPKKRYLDFLDVLLVAKDETGTGLTPLEIRSEVDTFMFEGHDTTASAVSWTLYSLCEHPEFQAKVQQEIDSVLQDKDSDDIEWANLNKLEYLTMVIKESMRLHCPVPIIGRCLTQPTKLEGVTLPTGTIVSVNIFNLHHNPLVWPDPWTFRPDRFHPDNMKGKDSYAFIPFSAGPRNCIGQHFAMNEMKVMLGRLLRRFTFSLDPTHPYPVEKKMAAVTRAMKGIKVFATPRTPTV